MLHEARLRRPEFRPGPAIRLADGQDWILPAPPHDRRAPGFDESFAPQYEAHLEAVTEAETEPEGRRAELALGLFLLEQNYVLGPADYAALFSAPFGGVRLEQIQDALHGVAWAHVHGRQRRRPERLHAATSRQHRPWLVDLRFWRRRPGHARPI